MQQNILKIKLQIIDPRIFSSKCEFRQDANLNECGVKLMFNVFV